MCIRDSLPALLQSAGALLLWTICNWATCTLIDGEGTMRDIWIAAAYSLTPVSYTHLDVYKRQEGASGWETFWKITFPTVSPFVLATIVYTIIDSFTSYDNQAMRYIRDYFMKDMNYSYAAAMAWMYFLLVLIILGLVVLLCRRMLFQKER